MSDVRRPNGRLFVFEDTTRDLIRIAMAGAVPERDHCGGASCGRPR